MSVNDDPLSGGSGGTGGGTDGSACNQDVQDAQLAASIGESCGTIEAVTLACPSGDVTYTTTNGCAYNLLADRGWVEAGSGGNGGNGGTSNRSGVAVFALAAGAAYYVSRRL